jgi:endonuclease YncB( thermonuclease family)
MRQFVLLLFLLAVPRYAFGSPLKLETLGFEKVVDGATIMASDQTVSFWGVQALSPADPVSFAANLYLKTVLDKSVLTCEDRGGRGRRIMRCYADGADIASTMAELGLVRAGDSYYQPEETYARDQHRGTWHGKPGRPL